jgi:hypothetical protein
MNTWPPIIWTGLDFFCPLLPPRIIGSTFYLIRVVQLLQQIASQQVLASFWIPIGAAFLVGMYFLHVAP